MKTKPQACTGTIVFKEDHRKTNPGLHLLYVKTAVVHLTVIDECLKKLEYQSNLNMLDSIQALYKERGKLVKNNAAYADAQEILDSITEKKD